MTVLTLGYIEIQNVRDDMFVRSGIIATQCLA